MSKNSTGSKPHDQTILVVDDNPDNLSVATDCLQGYGFRILVAQDGESALEKARYTRPDLILLDVMMPEVDGFETCRRLKADEQLQDIPVIFMTGLVDIRNKAEGFKLGAVDYVTQPFQLEEILARVTTHLRIQEQAKRLQRQATALEQEIAERVRAEEEIRKLNAELEQRVEKRTAELKEANERLRKEIEERKRAEEALRESEEKYRALVEQSSDGIVIIQDEIVQYVNPRVGEMWRGPHEEVIGTPFTDYVHPDELPKVADLYRRRMAGEKFPSMYETVLKRKDGSSYPAELSADLVTYRGRPADLVMIRDISERVRAEEEIKSLAKFPSENPNAVLRVSGDGEILYSNPAGAVLLELLGTEDGGEIPDDWRAVITRVGQSNKPTEVEYRGGDKVFSCTFASVADTGYVNIYGRDITERVQAEEMYRSLVDYSLQGLMVFQGGRMVFANSAYAKMVGYNTAEELLAFPPDEMRAAIHPEDRAMVLGRLRARLEGKEVPSRYEYRVIPRDGRLRWFELFANRIQYRGEPAVLAACVDITERKQAEEALRESEEQYRALFEKSLAAITLVDKSGVIIDCNASTETLTGYSKEEIVGKPFETLMTLDRKDLPRLKEIYEKLSMGLEVEPYELEIIRKGGKRRWINVINALLMKDDVVVGFQIFAADITERKLAEEALRESEERYRTLFESAGDAIFIHDLSGRILEVNRVACDRLGYSREELLQMTPMDVDAPEYAALVPERIEELRQHGHLFCETAHMRRDGTIIPIELNSRLIEYGGDQAVLSIARDITERVQAEEAHRSLVEYSLQGLAIFQDGRMVFANSALAEMFGPPLDLDVLLSLSPDEIRAAIHPEDREMVFGRLRARLEGKAVPPRYEFRIIRLDGSVRWLELFANRIQYQGRPAVQVAFVDITERMRAEEELRFQKTLLECQGEASIDGILVVSKDREWLNFNRRFVEMWGLPEEVVESRSGQASLQAVMDKLVDPEGFVAKIEHLYEHPDEVSRDEIVLKDGRVFDRYSAPVKSPDGVYHGRVWYYRDITARVRAEEQTQAALEEKEVLLKEIHHRVKNNLQVVSSLLSLQAEQIQDQQITELFQESQSRIRSMVLIHEQLYQSRALSRIDFAAYLRNLTGYLLRSYGERAQHTNLEVRAEDIFLSIDTAIPCGLIVNELVSNALKHAFPDGRRGEVCIELGEDDEGHMTLMIRDNGVGLPESVDFRDTQTLGLQLVIALTRQLEGSIELDSSDGTTFKLTFSETA